jgi:hypothetical protein
MQITKTLLGEPEMATLPFASGQIDSGQFVV